MPSKKTIERLKKKCELLEFYREAVALDLAQANSRIKILMDRIDRMDSKRLEKQNELMKHLTRVSKLSKPNNMKEMRINAELSIGEVQSETGLSKSAIWRIENGETKNPSWDALFKLILFYESEEQCRVAGVCERTRMRKVIQKVQQGSAFRMYNDPTHRGPFPY